MPTVTVDLLVPWRYTDQGCKQKMCCRYVGRALALRERQYQGVAVDLRGIRAVLLPGTGSDDHYVRRAFSGPVRAARGGAGDAAPAAGPVDRRLSVRTGRRRPHRSDRRRRCLDRSRGGGGLGTGPSRSGGRGAGRAAALDRGARVCACGALRRAIRPPSCVPMGWPRRPSRCGHPARPGWPGS